MKKVENLITLLNVHDFFNTLGYNWNAMYYVSENVGIVRAKEFKDLKTKQNVIPTLELFKDGDVEYLSFVIDEFTFKQVNNEKNKIVCNIDYTKQWVNFLAKKLGKTYFEVLENKISNEKRNCYVAYQEKIEDLELEIKKLIVKRDKSLKEIENYKTELLKNLKENKDEELTK